ncbi:MAG TPA: hypothetical protein VM621_08345 [Luteibacter sp.]|uniref:hypothetical protein n=1 Tax=Luteibacter sp. TaxID=1886636 RepID=UPI002BBA619A|nr:hypothetical protein [Luteibacter sp.]HVI55047.1 hypothetical protein [Luteibacter sp.]
MRTPVDARPSARTPDRSTAKPIDFSDVAPTRLQALDLMHASGQPDAARGGGSKPLVAFYTGLTDRMKLMEAQGLPISVVA